MNISERNTEVVLRLPPYRGHNECRPCKDDLLKKQEFTQDDIDIVVGALEWYFPTQE
jgi:hypothetical protein